MPLHVEVKINYDTLSRIHVGRMTNNGMQPDSVNEYSVVVSSEEPSWLEWEDGPRFFHRYGDGALVCVQKALEAYLSARAGEKI